MLAGSLANYSHQRRPCLRPMLRQSPNRKHLIALFAGRGIHCRRNHIRRPILISLFQNRVTEMRRWSAHINSLKVRNIDHRVRTEFKQNYSSPLRPRQFSVTESSVTLSSDPAEHHAPHRPNAYLRTTLQHRRACRVAAQCSTLPSVPMIMRHLSPKSLASGRRTEITWLCQSET
jgi:hypothetical protein